MLAQKSPIDLRRRFGNIYPEKSVANCKSIGHLVRFLFDQRHELCFNPGLKSGSLNHKSYKLIAYNIKYRCTPGIHTFVSKYMHPQGVLGLTGEAAKRRASAKLGRTASPPSHLDNCQITPGRSERAVRYGHNIRNFVATSARSGAKTRPAPRGAAPSPLRGRGWARGRSALIASPYWPLANRHPPPASPG